MACWVVSGTFQCKIKKGLIVQTSPVPDLINHILMTNDVHFKQNVDGTLTAGEIFSGDFDENTFALIWHLMYFRVFQKNSTSQQI